MAKQTINQGAAPTGAGGDTFRSGSAKLQANDDELYAAFGASGGVLPAALPITKGGTGATSAETARANLGLTTEQAGDASRYKSPGATKWMYITETGGWGAFDSTTQKYIPYHQIPYDTFTYSSSGINFNNFTKTGIYVFNGPPVANASNSPPVRSAVDTALFGVLEVIESAGRVIQRWNNSNASAVAQYFRFFWSTAWTPWLVVYHGANTTVDSNGFIKAASPIVQLFADKIEMNDEAQQQNIEFEKLGVGDYLIKGSSGFAQEGWYIETPKDANGNVLVAVVYEQLENGDISVKTYDYMLNKKGRIVADIEAPLDIPESRWIDLRLQELPQPEVEVTDDPEQ